MHSPWRISAQYSNSYVWDGQFNINLLIRTNNISLFSYNPQEEKILIYDIPDELYVNVPGGFGFWQLRSIFKLGEFQIGIGGNKLLAKTISSSFAIPIDGYLDLSELKSTKSAREIIDMLKQNYISGIGLLPQMKTNLTLLEFVRLKLNIVGVRFDKIKEIDLNKLTIFFLDNPETVFNVPAIDMLNGFLYNLSLIFSIT